MTSRHPMPLQNISGRLARALAWLRARPHARAACGCPACDPAERDARAAIGMPARHPERITVDLPGGQEEWLAALAAALWPDDEYTAIITQTRPEDRP